MRTPVSLDSPLAMVVPLLLWGAHFLFVYTTLVSVVL